MEKRSITFDKTPLIKGVEKLAVAVGSTLGPSGLNVLYEKALDYPVATKDGVTVARQIVLENPIENMGAQAVKEVAEKVVDAAGDGTTTATVIAGNLIKNGHTFLTSHPDQMIFFRDRAKEIQNFVLEEIDARRSEIASDDFDRIFQVAKISCNGDEPIAHMITEAFKKVGTGGTINVLRSRTGESYAELSDGFNFDRGYQMPEFVNVKSRMKVQYSQPLIFVYRETVKRLDEIEEFLHLGMGSKRPVVIIADGFEQHVLQELVGINRKGQEVCAIKTPGFGDRKRFVIEDMCVQIGAKAFDIGGMKMAMKNTGHFVGTCKTITVEANQTTIIGGVGTKEEVQDAQAAVKVLIEDSVDDYERSENRKRLSMLTNGVAVIRVGAQSEIALNERRDRVDDALGATRAAIEEGFLAGAGSTLAMIAEAYIAKQDKVEPLDMVFMEALREPMRQIHANLAIPKEKIERHIESLSNRDPEQIGHGFNQFGRYTDLLKEGIIDPSKVTRVCIEHAFSVALTILTTKAIINIIPENKKKSFEEFIDNGI